MSLRAMLRRLESDTELGKLDAKSLRTLEWIAERTQAATPLYVQEIVLRSDVASPATVHKIISTLEEAGFITASRDETDSRRRVVQTAQRTERLISTLSAAVDTWARSLVKNHQMRKSKAGI